MGYKFIDLFAGIGGIRFAFEEAGGTCIFSAEYDRYAQDAYEALFGERPDFAEIRRVDPPGDISKLPASLIPDHDILAAGFPCQPFSLAGVSKKGSLGSPHGFDDPAQGTLFFDIKRILSVKRPSAFLLENVKNLRSHDRGRTIRIITQALQKVGYDVHTRVINADGWLPQHRERIFLVGFRRIPGSKFDSGRFWRDAQIEPPAGGPLKSLGEIIDDDVPDKYTLGPGTWRALRRHRKRHELAGNGFGYTLLSKPYDGKVTRTISARYYKDGSEALIDQPDKARPRRLTPLECFRLMGFPTEFEYLFNPKANGDSPVSDRQAYQQFGNSVVVPVVADIARAMVKKMKDGGVI